MITLEKANEIVEKNEAFYFKDEIVNGIPFRIFNYRLPTYSDFEKAEEAEELRGLCFNLETGERFLGLHKFFNHNENPFAMGNENWNTLLEVREKKDGSLILPTIVGEEVIFRTKGTFFSEQAKTVNEKFSYLKNKIKTMMKEGYYPIFEYISPFNQIVVQYNNDDLVLIQIRKMKTGEYLNYEDMKKIRNRYLPNASIVEVEKLTLNEVIERQKTFTGVEGWVVYNPKEKDKKRQFRKFKTDWYLSLHRIIGEDVFVENRLIEHILNETIDDVISNLNKDSVKRQYIEKLRNLVSHYFDKKVKELEEIRKEREKMERKDFALKYKGHEYFSILMGKKSVEEELKKYIIKRTNKLLKAKEFIKKIEEELKKENNEIIDYSISL